MNIIRVFLSCFFLVSTHSFAAEISLENFVDKVQTGDYFVYEEGPHFSLLQCTLEKNLLYLREWNLPKKKRDWDLWIQEGCPGKSSDWIRIFDLEKAELLASFSVMDSLWLGQEESLLLRIFSLPWKEVEEKDRRREGKRAREDVPDFRTVWLSPFAHKRGEKQSLAFKGRWPLDGSFLEGKELELYFPFEERDIPSYFPDSIRVQGRHGFIWLHLIGAGNCPSLPLPLAVKYRRGA